ncbi:MULTISPECIES: MerR family transcriptional regulator [Amycolatopsis]|uniref:MerR family transcriptional regulator n=1 Tax=Amycolatopsis dongchuanensis TaxID=1070866 RepID=A0ABP8VSU4_9PSEU|nr:MerR family transcriptional regulator [Amycolatopsis sacchari]
MRIGEVTARTGVPRRLLRYYEEQELIVPGRDANGYRVYCEEGLARIRQIRELVDAGLPTRLIRKAMPHLGGPVCPELVAALRRRAETLGARIGELTERRDAVLRYLDEIGA